MSALYPLQERRRLGRKYRWAAIALWAFIFVIGIAIVGNLASQDDSGFRDDINPLVAILLLIVGIGIAVMSLAVVHSRSAAWRRAARVEVPPVSAQGTITDITHTRLASFVTIDVDGGSELRVRTRDRNDTWSVAGDAVVIELYGTEGTVLGAYRNERTGRTRAVSTRLNRGDTESTLA
ncbi:hypothetical protein EF847_08050 [Actinobacteria bacterium YIM 96077]|uniref:Uncharacterized protein n=1 Tax=Phytoactinopolyspora halophila TaxID=1981511 RepID=A0A329QE56_9ACTN|nr:hypothetical protein [Phytoactinopolyspora halophila]AYY12671.1 hypothetical protein EF847_08050 [Actinobacteria bacterium YIM 96077]RAW10584.1 hypothetical protein DPM12_18755 [Phytoactinopolyspora halophila]